MNVKLSKHTSGAELPKEYIALYIKSFPDDERRDWHTCDDVLEFLHSHPAMNILLATDKDSGQLVGFANYWWLGEDTIYLEHIATQSEIRNHGIGTEMLQWLKSVSGDKIILEAEPPDTDEFAKRRIEFYKRNGFTAHPQIEYYQPPYTPGKSKLRLTLMTSPQLGPLPLIPIIHRLVYAHPAI